MASSVRDNQDIDKIDLKIDDLILVSITTVELAQLTAIHIDEKISMLELVMNFQEQL
jgi:hypothetical protein